MTYRGFLRSARQLCRSSSEPAGAGRPMTYIKHFGPEPLQGHWPEVLLLPEIERTKGINFVEF